MLLGSSPFGPTFGIVFDGRYEFARFCLFFGLRPLLLPGMIIPCLYQMVPYGLYVHFTLCWSTF